MRGDVAYFASVADSLLKRYGVQRVTTNIRSASVVIEHSRTLAGTSCAECTGLFDIANVGTASADDGKERIASGGRAPRMHAAALGFTGIALYQAVKGKYASSPVENFWNSYGAYRTLHRPWLALGLAAVGVHQLLRGEILTSTVSSLYNALILKKMAEVNGDEAT
jgi:hypothetical protein